VATIVYRTDAPGDWGEMLAPAGGSTETNRLINTGQSDIFYRRWLAQDAPASLLWLHGLGAHSGWFIDLGNSIARGGVNFYAMDHHGFGRSSGLRGYTKDWHIYLTDIDRMVERVRADVPGKPVFVLGHSMGGVFAIHYAAAHQDKLRGMIALNPWIGDQTKLPLTTVISIVSGGIIGSKKVVPLPNAKGTDSMTDNPEADAMLQSDPYWVSARTKAFYWQITMMRGQTLARARKITIPVLMQQSDNDKSVLASASRKAFDAIPSKDKTYKTYPDYVHDPEFQRDRVALDADIIAWVKAHSS